MAANITKLSQSIDQLEPLCDGFHIDVMDGNFVSNIVWGPDYVNQVFRYTSVHLWLHLMVDDDLWWLDKLQLKNASWIDFHIEQKKEIKKTIARIRENNCSPGIALSPKTEPENIFTFLDLINRVTIMSVNPGLSGQRFLPEVIDKAKKLIEWSNQEKKSIDICFDGGINAQTIKEIKKIQKPTVVAVGSALFDCDVVEVMNKLRK
jgi:ribulose-phosphate 3-epimerase